MLREVDIDEISDGKRYHANDLVKIGCSDCKGCSSCCHDMVETIILDPYDIHMLCEGLGLTFDELLAGVGSALAADANMEAEPYIELKPADGLLLPTMRMNSETNACGFLSAEGRCGIHSFRPGFCRLFPLGRIYEDESFSYFIQIHECPYPNKTKIKIKNWLGIDNLKEYEKFVLTWHSILEETRVRIKSLGDVNEISKITVDFLKRYYRNPYQTGKSIAEQLETRRSYDIDSNGKI